jgi:hypothetical protein
VGLERGPLSQVSKIEELLGRKCSGFGLESREYDRRFLHADHVTHSIPQKLALTSPKSGGRSVGMVRSWTQAMEFVVFTLKCYCLWRGSKINFLVTTMYSICFVPCGLSPTGLYQ